MLSSDQQTLINLVGQALFDEATHRGEHTLYASIRRIALIAVRIAGILSLLRMQEEGQDLTSTKSFSPSPDDLATALELAEFLLEHARYLLRIMPESEEKIGSQRRKVAFLDSLPDEFRTATAVEIAASLKIPERTAKRYLDLFEREGLAQKVATGRYRKVPP